MWEEAQSENCALLLNAKNNLGLQFIPVGTGSVVAPFRGSQNPSSAEALSCLIYQYPCGKKPTVNTVHCCLMPKTIWAFRSFQLGLAVRGSQKPFKTLLEPSLASSTSTHVGRSPQ